jgi:acyl carrier protein
LPLPVNVIKPLPDFPTRETTMPQPVKTEIRAFIIENFLFGDEGYALSDEMSLIDNDLVDSTGILELVSFLEERFSIVMADADIVPANLDSLNRISSFIEQKLMQNASVPSLMTA